MNNNFKQYLPSKRFLISIGVLLGIGALFMGIRYIVHRAAKNADPSQIIVTNLLNPVEVDTDNDGVYDWEEALWGTDPQNPDSDADGIPDGVAIERKKNELALSAQPTGDETETDKFAKDIYTTIAIAAQGGLTEEKSLALQNDIAKALVNKSTSENQYQLSSLITVENNDTNTERYVAELTEFLNTNRSVLSKITTTTEQLQSNTIDPALFTATGEKLTDISKDLLDVSVPQGVTTTHLLLINSIARLGEIISNLALLEQDPLVAFSYGIEHQDALINYSVAVANIGAYFDGLR